MLWKCYIQYVSKFGKLSCGHRTRKHQISFQAQRREMPKNAQTFIQFCSFAMLVRFCSKFFKLGFSSTWTENFKKYNLCLEKAEEPEMKLSTFLGSQRKQRNSRKTSTSASLTTLKPLTVWITTNYGKFLKRWEYQTTLLASWEACKQVRKQQLEPNRNNGLVQNWERSMSSLYIVTLLI